MSTALSDDALRRMVEAALPVAKERAQLLGDIRAAILRGDLPTERALVRRLVGLPPDMQAVK